VQLAPALVSPLAIAAMEAIAKLDAQLSACWRQAGESADPKQTQDAVVETRYGADGPGRARVAAASIRKCKFLFPNRMPVDTSRLKADSRDNSVVRKTLWGIKIFNTNFRHCGSKPDNQS